MFPSLSDRTKSFIAAAAVFVVAVCNIVFGMDWVAERPATRPLAAVAAVPEPPVMVSPPVQAARPAAPAAAGGLPINRNAAAPPDNRAAPASSAAQMNDPGVLAPEAAPPKCDIAACAQAYRSFQQSDCTYQPNVGPRRLCTKGTADSAAANARAEENAAGFARCNRRACAEAYSSFNPSDCTYQPLDGPRRLCAK